MKFSERYGYKAKQTFQLENMDDNLRMDIWNILYENYFHDFTKHHEFSPYYELIKDIWTKIYKLNLENFYYSYPNLNNKYDNLEWFEIYDLIDLILEKNYNKTIVNEFNECLEKNNSAYRIIKNQICRITEKSEIDSIEESIENPNDSVQKHMNKALNLLSDRENPDYENCVKESISAVESLCKIILKENGIKSDNFTLGHALNEMSNSEEINLNADFKDGFKNLFHFTSSTDGMRHGEIKEEDVNFNLAKLMLVTCSAFTNYLQTTYL